MIILFHSIFKKRFIHKTEIILKISNKNNFKKIYLTQRCDPKIFSNFWFKIGLEVMAMKRYSTFVRPPKLKPCRHMPFNIISLFEREYQSFAEDTVSIFSTLPSELTDRDRILGFFFNNLGYIPFLLRMFRGQWSVILICTGEILK